MSDETPSSLPTDFPADPTLSHIPRERFRTGAPAGENPASQLATWATVGGPAEGAAAPAPADAGPQYVLRRVIGAGGMGQVWEATQNSLGRLVAVKRAFAGTGESSGARLAEFRQEAVIAGRLEHPNIVPVHDLGLGEDGAPLLAMKLVRGRPWDRTLREDFAALPADELIAKHLPVLIAVGQAVAFAHSRGIVHRDIKPAQVMTGEFGEALLMDWGLAIQTSEAAAERRPSGERELVATPETATNPAGTIALMAPEQTAPDARGIGTWTDVYLLGGTLYYLLTGTFPHEAGSTAAAFAKACIGDIDDPRKRAPDRAIPEDLAELAIKSLAKAPADRVPSAKAFVETLQDHLAGTSKRRESKALAESARALLGAPPRTYADFARIAELLERSLTAWSGNAAAQAMMEDANAGHAAAAIANGDLVLGRTMAERLQAGANRESLLAEADRREAAIRSQQRQRRLLLASSFALLVTVIAGGAVFTYKLDEQRQIAEANALRAERKAREAKESRGQSDGLVRFMITDLSRKLAPLDEELDALREAAIRAADYYTTQTLHADRLDNAERASTVSSLLDVAGVLSTQGETERSHELSLRAAEFSKLVSGEGAELLRADTRISLGQSFRRIGRNAEAMRTYLDAAAEVEKLPGIAPGTPAGMVLGRALLCYGDMLSTQGRGEEALDFSLRGMAAMGPPEAPGKPGAPLNLYTWGMFKVSAAQALVGDEEASLETLADLRALLEERAAKLGSDKPFRGDIAAAHSRIGFSLEGLGRDAEALAAHEASLAIRERILAENPTNQAVLAELAVSITRIGGILAKQGRHAEARAALERGLAIRERQVAADPENMEWRSRLRAGYQRLAELHQLLGDWPEERRAYDAALAVGDSLIARDAGGMSIGASVSILVTYAYRCHLNGESAQAVEVARRACALAAGLPAPAPPVKSSWAYALSLISEIHAEAGLADAAEAAACDVLEVISTMPRAGGDQSLVRARMMALHRLGRLAEARDAVQRALAAGIANPDMIEDAHARGLLE